MRREVVGRVICRGEHVDAELPEERTRPELVLDQAGRDLVVDGVRGERGWPLGDLEDLRELGL